MRWPQFHFEFNVADSIFFILPLAAVQHSLCEDPKCTASHWKISLGWLVFELGIVVTL